MSDYPQISFDLFFWYMWMYWMQITLCLLSWVGWVGCLGLCRRVSIRRGYLCMGPILFNVTIRHTWPTFKHDPFQFLDVLLSTGSGSLKGLEQNEDSGIAMIQTNKMQPTVLLTVLLDQRSISSVSLVIKGNSTFVMRIFVQKDELIEKQNG